METNQTEVQTAEMAENTTVENLKLCEELQSRGFYVNKISRGETVDYLVVTTAPPQNLEIVNELKTVGLTVPKRP